MRNANIAYIKSVVYKQTLDTVYAEYLICVEAYNLYKQAYEESKSQLGLITELDARRKLEIQDLNAQVKREKKWLKAKGWLMFVAGGTLVYLVTK